MLPCKIWHTVSSHGYAMRGSPGKWGTKRYARYLMCEHLGRRLSRQEFVCHTCDNRACIEFSHLYVGSAATNNKDTMDRHPTKRESSRAHLEVIKASPEFRAASSVRMAAQLRSQEFRRRHYERLDRLNADPTTHKKAWESRRRNQELRGITHE